MYRSWAVFAVVFLCAFQSLAQTPEYDRSYGSTAADYPAPAVSREGFAPVDFVDASGSTAIFTIVEVEGIYLEEAKAEIRNKLPNAHVRQIVSGSGGLSDQSLMVMWHPKEAYRPAINDYFRVLNPMRGVKATYTSLGVSKRFPRSYPGDTMIGWKFVKFETGKRAELLGTFSEKLVADPRAGSGNLHRGDKWNFCLTSA